MAEASNKVSFVISGVFVLYGTFSSISVRLFVELPLFRIHAIDMLVMFFFSHIIYHSISIVFIGIVGSGVCVLVVCSTEKPK